MKRDTHAKKKRKKRRGVSLIWGVALLSLKCLAHFLLLYFDQFFNDAPYKLEFLSLDGTNSNGKSVENGGKMIELPTFPDQVQSEFGTKWKHSENLAQRTLPILTRFIYILDSSNFSLFTVWPTKVSSSSICNRSSNVSNQFWVDKFSCHFVR